MAFHMCCLGFYVFFLFFFREANLDDVRNVSSNTSTGDGDGYSA